jgi:hypothetical protein
MGMYIMVATPRNPEVSEPRSERNPMFVRSLRKRKDSEEVEYPAYGITGTISLYQSRVNSDPGWLKNG